MNKKNVMIMRNNVKNIETKLPQLRININFWLRLAVLAGVAGLMWAYDATFSTLVGIYLGYKLLRLILRIFGLVVSLFLTVVSAAVVAVIISLLLF
jgi:hypothetical protein